jgi:hypothetical protein
MSTFQLSSDGSTYVLDTAGNVMQNGSAIGQWNTDASNNIVVSPNGPVATTGNLPVFSGLTWQFVNNRLCLSSGGRELINFHTLTDGTQVDYMVTDTASLQILLSGSGEQVFTLAGTWNFDTTHTLSFITLDGAVSKLANGGLISRVTNGFAYDFSDNVAGNADYILSFSGKWGQDANDKTKLTFTYATGTFTMPGDLSFDQGTNQLQYFYSDIGGVSWGLSLTGTLAIDNEWTISYLIDENSQNGVQSTTIVIHTTLNLTRFSGSLDLRVTDSAGITSISLGGSFQAMPGDNTLNVGFSINQTSGQPLTVTFSGTLQTKSGVDLSFSFSQNAAGKTISFNVSQFKLGPFTGSEQFKLTDQSGKGWAVQGLLNWSF